MYYHVQTSSFKFYSVVGAEFGSSAVDDAAVFIFVKFCNLSTLSSNDYAKMREKFGVTDKKLLDTAHKLVTNIVEKLSYDTLELISSSQRKKSNKEFGSNLKFVHNDTNYFDDMGDYTWLDSDSESEGSDNEFDMKYVEVPDEKTDTKRKDATWLREQIECYFGADSDYVGMTVADLSAAVFETLNSKVSDSELQNDLFELLGFDRFELIQLLLENRKKILTDTANSVAVLSKKLKGMHFTFVFTIQELIMIYLSIGFHCYILRYV